MLNLGAKQTPPKVGLVPYIPMLKVKNVRKGFFEHGQFLAFRSSLPFYLQGFVTLAYKVGWRKKEISGLTWNQVDLLQGIVRLEVGESKDDEGRTVYVDDELKEMLKRQWENRKKSGKICRYVHPNEEGTGQIKDFRGVWNKACRDNGLGYGYKKSSKDVRKWQSIYPAGPTLHDFRRTAVRNMVRAVIPERVAMMVSGHKTRFVFDRYNIVNDSDIKQAAQKQAAYLNKQTGTNTGTVAILGTK